MMVLRVGAVVSGERNWQKISINDCRHCVIRASRHFTGALIGDDFIVGGSPARRRIRNHPQERKQGCESVTSETVPAVGTAEGGARGQRATKKSPRPRGGGGGGWLH